MKPKSQLKQFGEHAQADWVLASLEHSQLVRERNKLIPRRRLRGRELILLWGLRIYVVFMMIVVLWEVWTAAH